MPAYVRRELLTAAQRAELLALPTDRLEIRERYSLTPADFDLINRHCYITLMLLFMRLPGPPRKLDTNRARRNVNGALR